MKIGIIAHALYPIAEPFAGGLEKITQVICNELSERGHEVILFAKKGSKIIGQLVEFPSIDEFESSFYADEHKWLGLTRDEMFQMFIYNKTMSLLPSFNFDIIHNHSLHHIPIVQGLPFGRKYFTTFHTPIFTQLRFGLKCLTPNNENQYTSVSKFQERLYNEFVPSTVVYNGVELNKWQYQTDTKEDYVFWMGRICPEKAPHQAIQACIDANQTIFLAGPNSNEEYFTEEVEPLLDHVCIHYLGHLNQIEINDYLKKAKAYLFTSTWDEPYGLTMAEALVCGTPVIAYNVGAASEIITKNSGFIIPKEDIQSLKKALLNIETIKYSDCRKRAEEFCGIDQMIEGYLKLYKNV